MYIMPNARMEKKFPKKSHSTIGKTLVMRAILQANVFSPVFLQAFLSTVIMALSPNLQWSEATFLKKSMCHCHDY